MGADALRRRKLEGAIAASSVTTSLTSWALTLRPEDIATQAAAALSLDVHDVLLALNSEPPKVILDLLSPEPTTDVLGLISSCAPTRARSDDPPIRDGFTWKIQPGIRRLRLTDVDFDPFPLFDEVANLNFWAYSVTSPHWYAHLKAAGYFAFGPGAYSDACKRLSTAMKTRVYDIDALSHLCELQSLLGYRFYPSPDFDFEQQVHAASEPRQPWQLGGRLMSSFVDQVFSLVSPPALKYSQRVTFIEYLESCIWARAGSSGTTLDMEYGGETFKVTASKAMLSALETPQALEDACAAQSDIVNKAFAKNELAKIRIAWSGDLRQYLRGSYLLEHLVDSVAASPYACLNIHLSSIAALNDQHRQLTQEHKYCLPFDYEAFDAQVTPDMVMAIAVHFFGPLMAAEGTIGDLARHHVSLYAHMRNRATTSNGRTFDAPMAQLPSGDLLTSKIGDIANTVVQLVAIAVQETLFHSSPQLIAVRGDDTSLTGDRTALIRHMLLLAAIGVKFSPAKSSIRDGATEFLRVMFTRGKLTGYIARAIPSLTSRKPQSNDPWTPEAVVTAQADAIFTLGRRGARNIQVLADVVGRAWARTRGLPSRILSIPRSLGGLGIFQPASFAVYRVTPSFPKLTAVPGVERWYSYESAMAIQARKDCHTDPDIVQRKVIDHRAQTMVTSEAVRPAARELRLAYQKLLKSYARKCRIKVSTVRHPRSVMHLAQAWGKAKLSLGDFRLAQERKAAGAKVRPVDVLNEQSRAYLRSMERGGLHRTSALAILFGESLTAQANIAPPLMASLTTREFLSLVAIPRGRIAAAFSLGVGAPIYSSHRYNTSLYPAPLLTY